MSGYEHPRIIGSKRLPPDPSLVSAIGLHHSLSTAVADLVDNSIDAGAGHVLIRFLRSGGRAVGLHVIDDGQGMDAKTADVAMTYAHKREYEAGSLGHFGLGLKAASLSQADTLAVWSRAFGCGPVGRLIDHQAVGRDHEVSELDVDQAATRLENANAGFDLATGTVVEWRDVRSFLNSSDADEQTSWLEQTIEDIRNHLGIVLHRILAQGKVSITIDAFDLDLVLAGVPRTVKSIDPFGYPRSGANGYPRTLEINVSGGVAYANAHVWPPRSNAPEYRLAGEPGRRRQGFYFYRNDRLLQIGGWNGVVNERPDYELGRISVDIDDVVHPHVTVNSEKSGLQIDASLAHAIESARFTEGTGAFRDYLAELESGSRAARQRKRRPIDVVEPGAGFPGDLLDVFEDNLKFKEGEDPVDVRWRSLPPDQVFEVDRDRRTLWLNLRHRRTLVGRHSLDPNDAPVLKALFHLLMSRHFEGTFAGVREKRELEVWQLVLSAAVETQARQQEERDDQ